VRHWKLDSPRVPDEKGRDLQPCDAWIEDNVARRQAALAFLAQNGSVAATARRFEVSRMTLYRWQDAVHQGGPDALRPKIARVARRGAAPASALVQAMYDDYLGGMSLADLAERWRLDVATISRAFREAGLAMHPRVGSRQLLGRSRREQLIDEVLRRFAELRDVEATATATRTPVIMVRRYLAERRITAPAVSLIEHHRPRRRAGDTERLVRLLREAAEQCRPLTTEGYAELARRHAAHGWPSATTILRRFGTWNDALRAAGVEDALSPRSRPTAVFTKADCIDALRAATLALQGVPTHRTYMASFDHAVKKVPTPTVVVQRFGSWREALLEAEVGELLLDMAVGRQTGRARSG